MERNLICFKSSRVLWVPSTRRYNKTRTI